MSTLPSSDKLFQLEKVLHLRVIRTHREYNEKLQEWQKLHQEVDELQAQYDLLQHELDQVTAYNIRYKNQNDPQRRITASDRRHWLIYDQDLIKYDLDVALSDLEEATAELNQLKSNWLRARHREHTIADKGELAVVREALVQEELQETEVEDQRASGVVSV